MNPVPHKVGIVVDPTFGLRLGDLARRFHVWVVDAGDNAPVIRQLWNGERANTPGDPLGSGVTAFTVNDAESAEATCARVAGDVDEHHGEFGHHPPWSEIEVFGTELSPALQVVFQSLGATVFVPTSEGFVCRR
jgi:hypothetical protein